MHRYIALIEATTTLYGILKIFEKLTINFRETQRIFAETQGIFPKTHQKCRKTGYFLPKIANFSPFLGSCSETQLQKRQNSKIQDL